MKRTLSGCLNGSSSVELYMSCMFVLPIIRHSAAGWGGGRLSVHLLGLVGGQSERLRRGGRLPGTSDRRGRGFADAYNGEPSEGVIERGSRHLGSAESSCED